MKTVHKLLILTALLIVLTSQTAVAIGISQTAVLYLRVAAGARPAGMGEAFVSIADDATATYWNPAGLGNAPISGSLKTTKIPKKYNSFSDAITLKRGSNIESWCIADNQLLMHNGSSWNTGKDYITSSNQSLPDFIGSIISLQDEYQIEQTSKKIILANCPVSENSVNAFVGTVRTNTPENYSDLETLNRGLDTLAASYKLCLMSAERFNDLNKKLTNGMKDSVLTSEELDKITFSLESAVSRFLPSRLLVPYSAPFDGNLTCLSKTSQYLWVGTDNGLYRLSGNTWARYSIDEGLPSNEILSLNNAGDHLLIGTSSGVAKYLHGSFTTFGDIPTEPATAVVMQTPTRAFAVIGNVVYNFDGIEWSNSYGYTVQLTDSIDKIAQRAAIYKTKSEIEYFTSKIRELNAEMIGDEYEQQLEIEQQESGLDEETSETSEVPQEIEQVQDTAAALAESDVNTSPETVDNTLAITKSDANNAWLMEGNIIRIPYSGKLKYDVTALTIDLSGVLWVGTKSGLLSFDGKEWSRYGYAEFTVPEPDSGAEAVVYTSETIARQSLPSRDPEKIALLAGNIDDYNELNGQPVEPGRTVYVYNWNTGAAIHSIGIVNSQIYVGTEYGLETKTNSGWESADFENLDREQVVASYDYDGQTYFVSRKGIINETKGQKEIVLMHVNWLPSFQLDIYYDYAAYVHHKRGLGTIGFSIIYLNYGSIPRTNTIGQDDGTLNPFEIAVSGSFGTSISSRLKWGITGRVIHSRLSPQGTAAEQGEGIATTFSIDTGILYKLTRRLQLGAAITNLGPDITYIDADQSDALPRNFAFGLSFKAWNTPFHSLIIQTELNKILVGIDKNFSTELKYAIRHVGAEYWYANFIALRGGYKYDKEGQVKHMTFGAGLKITPLRLDFAFIPSSIDSPLSNTLRISATGTF